MRGTLTCGNGASALPNFQGTASYNHPISFLLAALKQYFPLFSLDESDTIL